MNPLPELSLLKAPFYFLRHGESESNLNDTIAGSADVPLTDRGRVQAREAARRLQHKGITAIYSSGLSRARDTADEVARTLALPVVVIPALAERNWGELEGKPRSTRLAGVTPPGAETPDQFQRRVIDGLAAIEPGGIPLVVSHSGVFRTLCALLRLPAPRERVANAQPVRFVPPNDAGQAWRIDVVSCD